MKEVSKIQNLSYNFRSEATYFKWENIKTTDYGIQSETYLESKIWDMVPSDIKKLWFLTHFIKEYIKSCKANEFLCRLCKSYVASFDLHHLYKSIFFVITCCYYFSFISICDINAPPYFFVWLTFIIQGSFFMRAITNC